MKQYYEVKIYVKKGRIEPLTEALENIGVEGVVIDDPDDILEFLNKKNEYDWDYVDAEVLDVSDRRRSVTFYVDSEDADMTERLIWLEGDRIGLKTGALIAETEEIVIKFVSDDDWKDKWKEYFKPARISRRVTVVPTWEEYHNESGKDGGDELIIRIDPGMAFGTGTHETTSLCVKLMEKYMKQGHTALDVGCGSGILTIAAALLGAAEVTGIDIDPEAIRVSKENVDLNFGKNSNENIKILKGDLTKGLSMKVDLIAANLMADLVVMLAPDAVKHLKEGGIFISSGILIKKKESVSHAIQDAGFQIMEIVEDGEWCAICGSLGTQPLVALT